jgi:hypothetical protein
MQVEAFFQKMYDQGYTMHCELYEWIPKDYTEVSVIMHRDDDKTLYFFCLEDNTWILCSDYHISFAHSKVLRYA